jgi:hypothetical protein
MSTARMEVGNPDGGRAHLRAVMATIDHELSVLSGQRMRDDPLAKSDGLLSSSWAELVELLALGPAPRVRKCPSCKHTGMFDATRCGYCWTQLSPLGGVEMDVA